MLIDELKKEHAQITGMLQKVSDAGITSKEGQAFLASAREGLLAHLKKEDEHLYPVLWAAAELDNDIKRTVDFFARDTHVVSQAALHFFSKYEHGSSGIEFARDCGRLLYLLKSRISKEESILYETYRQITGAGYKASA